MAGKYHNKETWRDGIKFDSLTEADYYSVLKERQSRGEISNLRTQVGFELIPAVKGIRQEIKHLKKGDKIVDKEYVVQRATYYYADFVYHNNATGLDEVIDVKSEATRKKESYILKKKMMLAFKGIKIIEVYRQYNRVGKKRKKGRFASPEK